MALQVFETPRSGERSTELDGTKRHKKPIVGLAGGIGSGKSAVAKILNELGAGIIESDRLGHLEINAADVKQTLIRWWGKDILAPDGTVDRAKVAAVVFQDPAQRNRLEALVHPRIAIRRADMIAELEQQPKIKMIVLDSPLLYETDLDLLCDAVVFVDADDETRKERSEKQRNWAAGELARREKSHQPLDMKRARADYVCKNNSSLADLRKQVEHVFAQIIKASGVA